MGKKPRGKAFAGGVAAIVAAIQDSVTCATWLDYPEDAKVMDVKKIIKTRQWLQKLKVLYDPLAFKITDFQAALKEIADNGDTWEKPLNKKHVKQWTHVHAKRMMLVCQHYAKYYSEDELGFPGNGGSEDDGEKSLVDQAAGQRAGTVVTHYGFCDEKRAAWRALSSDPKAIDYTMDLYIEPQMKDNDAVKARWGKTAVGEELHREVQEVTVKEYVEMMTVEWESHRGPLRVMKFKDDETKAIEIHKTWKQATSRKQEMLILFLAENADQPRKEQKRSQLSQLIIENCIIDDEWGPEHKGEKDIKTPTKRAMVASRQNALATFKLISCKIADGTISPDGATAERDELIAKYGYTTGKRTHTDIPTDAPATKTQKMSAKTGVTKCTVVDGTPAKPNKKMLAAPTSTSTSTSTAASSFTVPASGLHEAFEAIADGSLQLDECDFEESQTS
ncbi:unnamed protein product [Prorocentrum cordatum]|uniref:Uncharacterized protein n=1 Tax=Prorocentrum cordatum TaxID=2364126 RepID=A0ABN9W4A0_9DINO|nr:unnamed protein product [Polarella glacialis]